MAILRPATAPSSLVIPGGRRVESPPIPTEYRARAPSSVDGASGYVYNLAKHVYRRASQEGSVLPKVMDLLPAGEVMTGGLDYQPTAREFNADMHQPFELGIVIRGEVDRRFGDFEVTLGPGDIWLVSAWEPHAYRWRGTGNFRLLVCFLPQFLGDESFDDVSWLSLFAAAPAARPWVRTDEVRRKAVSIAHEVGWEFQNTPAGWRTAVRQGVLGLLLLLFRSWELPREHASLRACRASNLSRMAPALDLVQSRPARRTSLEEAAAVCSMSVTHFRFLFRQTMGTTFGIFDLRARLSHAARLLAHTNLPLKAISEQTGFVDHSHLHRAFVKAYGCTPGRYREQHEREVPAV